MNLVISIILLVYVGIVIFAHHKWKGERYRTTPEVYWGLFWMFVLLWSWPIKLAWRRYEKWKR